MNLALIDGDILLYRCGFATQRTRYRLGERLFPEGTTQLELAKQGILDAEKYFEAEPIENSCHLLKTTLNKILVATNSPMYELYVSGGGPNFRHEVAKTTPYKGNRKADKPVNYVEMHRYLVEWWGASEVSEIETDDRLGIRQVECIESGQPSIIVSIDKDLLQIPGKHYNFVVPSTVESVDPGTLSLSANRRSLKGTGLKWFCAQMLLGDTADNIPGVPGIGPVGVFSALGKLNTLKALQKQVIKLYLEHGIENRLMEIAQLLWIQRKENDSVVEYFPLFKEF